VRRRDPPVAPPPRAWYARPTIEVARDLVGCALIVDAGTPDAVVARIVETEAYLGVDDPASHAYRGPTQRSAIMFGAPAHLYVYLSYGMHHCVNVVTEAAGIAGAVLLRAAAVEEGAATVAGRRAQGVPIAGLLRGPGNLCRGLEITRADNGVDLLGPGSRVRIEQRPDHPRVLVSRRVGIRHAADRPLRFSWLDDPAVSRPVPRQEAESERTAAPAGDKKKGPD
jgi:DNA-3-methyladenine glycosylase